MICVRFILLNIVAYSFNSWFVFRCLKDFNTVKHGSPESSVSRKIFCDHWNVTDAPLSGNIIWEHLSVDHESWWARALLINSLLFIFVLFLTTPAVVLTTLRELKASIGEHTWSNEGEVTRVLICKKKLCFTRELCKQSRRQRQKTVIWLVEWEKIIVLHVRHAL